MIFSIPPRKEGERGGEEGKRGSRPNARDMQKITIGIGAWLLPALLYCAVSLSVQYEYNNPIPHFSPPLSHCCLFSFATCAPILRLSYCFCLCLFFLSFWVHRSSSSSSFSLFPLDGPTLTASPFSTTIRISFLLFLPTSQPYRPSI